MKYGLTRNINVYSIGNQKGEVILSPAGDYIQSQFWCQKNLKGVEEGIVDLYQSYVWAWYALKRSGKLEDFGLPSELDRKALDRMTEDVTVFLEVVKDDSLPLAYSVTVPTR